MNAASKTESGKPHGAKKIWRSALDGARDWIRNDQHGRILAAKTPPPTNAEILGVALRVRQDFKGVQESNAQMLQALADFKNRRRKMHCERGLNGPSAIG
jgi:hypothetical protein